MSLPVSISDIEAAAARLAGHAVRTPLIENPVLNERVGGRVFIKPESLQRTGSFKFRGAWNRISRLDKQHDKGGVVAFSSGNHAQGVAAAAQLCGLSALIVMPSDTPAIKQANTRRLGAEIVLYDRATENREAIARALAHERGAVLVPPYDDPLIIAGQGTAGLELAQDISALGASLDGMLVCCSGGGLSAGIAIALASRMPSAEVFTVEPEGFDDTARSLAAGTRQRNQPGARSICDGLLMTEPGEITFPINQRLIKAGFAVSEAEVREAMRFAFRELKLVVEPSGAVALAAVLCGKHDGKGRNTGIVISGGNADPSLFADVISG